MRLSILWIVWTLLVASSLFQSSTAQNTTDDAPRDRFVATFNLTTDIVNITTFNISFDIPAAEAFTSFLSKYASEFGDVYETIRTIPGLNAVVMLISQTLARRINELPFVVRVEIDRKIYFAPTINDTKAASFSAEETPYGIDMVGALNVSDENVGDIKVCIIDSGYDATHPDLPTTFVSGDDDVGYGTWNEDGYGHGTHVAGIIAAIGGNEQGVVGVARSGAIQLHIVRVFDDNGEIYVSDLVTAIQSCVDADAKIVSLSLGQIDSDSSFERSAFDRYYNDEGILFIAAAGNHGGSAYSYPASYDSVISVAAIDEYKDVGLFSAFNDQVELAAPGVSVLSTVPGGFYEYKDGTSMACPHVTGVAALIWSMFPDKSNVEIRAALIASAEDLGVTGYDVDYGYGLVRADVAVTLLQGGDVSTVPPQTSDPPPSEGGCEDSPSDWVDADGFGCSDFYTDKETCVTFGFFSADDTYKKTASEVCCVCGGGSNTDECVDDTEWKDATGDGCEWYDQSDRCELFGSSFENDGKTAHDACCTCQSITSTTLLATSKSSARSSSRNKSTVINNGGSGGSSSNGTSSGAAGTSVNLFACMTLAIVAIAFGIL